MKGKKGKMERNKDSGIFNESNLNLTESDVKNIFNLYNLY